MNRAKLSDTERRKAHEIMDEAERLAHTLRLVTGDRLSLAVTDNHPRMRRQREGMDWYNAHEAVERVARGESPSNAQLARWQVKLDRDFPRGLIAAWEPSESAVYLVPRVVVVALEDLDPVVWFYAFSGSDKVLGPWRMLDYERIQQQPRMVRVSFENVSDVMTWNAGISPELAIAMAGDRDRLMKVAPYGGRGVLSGHSESQG